MKTKGNINISETVIIDRIKIKFADYNPRIIDENTINIMKRNFKKIGYLGGIIWNETTGNLLSGHVRVMALDSINKFDGTNETSYQIKVEKVNFDDKTEKEQNIFMNSQSAQGKMDWEKMALIMPDIEPLNAGLNESDINIILATSNIYSPQNLDNINNDFGEYKKNYEELKEAAKQAKKNIKEQNQAYGVNYVTLSFDNSENKADFMAMYGFKPEDKIIKGEILANRINGN